MIYDDHSSTEWDSLTRDEAMVRAFVLSIDAARGDEHLEELDRLREEDTRAYIEMAYRAGQRKYLDIEEESTTNQAEPDENLPTATTSELVSELIVPQHNQSESDETRRGGSRIDVPAMLEEFEFLDTRPDEQERLGLPDFLQG